MLRTVSPTLPRSPAARGRTGRCRGPRTVPPGVARSRSPQRGGRTHCADAIGPAPRSRDPGVDPGDRRPSGPDPRVSTGRPRRDVGRRATWCGSGQDPIAGDDGRVVLCFRRSRRHAARARRDPGTERDRRKGELHDAIRGQLSDERRVVLARPGPGGRHRRRAGLLLRASGTWCGRARSRTTRWDRCVRSCAAPVPGLRAPRPGTRPRPGALRRTGPPAGAGRWSLVAPLLRTAASATEIAHARALQLLDRHGVVTRESVLAEGVPGGSPACTPCSARWRRPASSVAATSSRGSGLHSSRSPVRSTGCERSATNPSRPATTTDAPSCSPPPTRRSPTVPRCRGRRRTGGPREPPAPTWCSTAIAAAFLERGARSLVTFDVAPERWVDAVASLVKDGRLRKIELPRIDGDPPSSDSPARRRAPRGRVRRRLPGAHPPGLTPHEDDDDA